MIGEQYAMPNEVENVPIAPAASSTTKYTEDWNTEKFTHESTWAHAQERSLQYFQQLKFGEQLKYSSIRE